MGISLRETEVTKTRRAEAPYIKRMLTSSTTEEAREICNQSRWLADRSRKAILKQFRHNDH